MLSAMKMAQEISAKNEWLAELLRSELGKVTDYWIEEIRSEGIIGYQSIPDEQLKAEFPPTVDSMIYAFQTGDMEVPRQHSIGIIRRRLASGFLLTDLQMSLHALKSAVMRVVTEAGVDINKRYEALQSAATMYYIVALMAAMVYEQLRAEQQNRFTTAYEFGIELSRTLDLNVVLDTAVHKVAEYIKGKSVVILLSKPDDEHDEVQASYNLDPETLSVIPSISEAIKCNDSPELQQATSIVPDIRSFEQLDEWAGQLTSGGYLSMICTQLIAKQNRLGCIIVLWSETHIPTDSEKSFLLALATHIANAVQNAILYEEAKGKRELITLLEASRLFSSSLNTSDILAKMAKMATEAVRIDIAMVFILDYKQERSRHIAHYSNGINATKAIQHIADILIPDEKKSIFDTLGQDFIDGKALIFNTAEEFSEQFLPLTGEIGSVSIIPLRHKDTLLGAFVLASFDQNVFTESELYLATGLADLAAVAIENAQLYEHERNIAEAMQRSILPTSLPSIKGYEAAVFYKPAMAEAEIGGDFYDIFITSKDKIGVVIGDVSGKGLKAAVSTAMGKYLARAYAVEDPSPASVLKRFNRAYYEMVQEYSFMTAFYGILCPEANVFTYVSAGHDPPLLYSAKTGRVEQIPTGGLSLGICEDVVYVERELRLQPGDVLLLYTDGATDARVGNTRLGVEGLQELFQRTVSGSAEEIVRNTSEGIRQLSNGRITDDIALVVLKRL